MRRALLLCLPPVALAASLLVWLALGAGGDVRAADPGAAAVPGDAARAPSAALAAGLDATVEVDAPPAPGPGDGVDARAEVAADDRVEAPTGRVSVLRGVLASPVEGTNRYRLWAWGADRASRNGGGTLRVEPDGRFELPVKLHVGQTVVFVVAPEFDPVRRATVVRHLDRPEAAELGTFAVRPAPVLVQGAVVDAAGRPVPDAFVRVSARVEGAGRSSFTVMPSTAPRTGDDGRFRVHGHEPWSRLQVTVTRDDLPTRQLWIDPGESTDVRLELRGAGELTGVVLLDTPALRDELSIVLDPRGPDRRIALAHDGSWSTWARDGAAELTVTLKHTGERIVQMDDLEVVDGATTTDPRLSPLDLRGAVVRVPLTVRGPDGTARADAVVRLLDADGDELGDARRTDAEGRVTLVAQGPTLDVRVHAAGCVAHVERGLDGAAEVRLSPGPLVQVPVEGRELLARGERVFLLVSPPGGVDVEYAPIEVPAFGPASFNAVGPGVHRYHLVGDEEHLDDDRLSGRMKAEVDEDGSFEARPVALSTKLLERARRRAAGR